MRIVLSTNINRVRDRSTVTRLEPTRILFHKPGKWNANRFGAMELDSTKPIRKNLDSANLEFYNCKSVKILNVQISTWNTRSVKNWTVQIGNYDLL